MSEPITLTERPELDALIAAAVAVAEAMSPEERAAMVEAQRQSWVRGEQGLRRPTESASPPRAPGASAHPLKVGVESGPGQPIDIVERLARIRGMIGKMCREGRPPAMTVPADPARDEDLFIADAADEADAEIRRLREQVKTERRAGIEAAAKYHDDQAAEWSEHYTKNGNDPSAREYAKQHSADAAAIRALADKPAPDARKGG